MTKTEYAVMLAIVIIVAMVALTTIGGRVNNLLQSPTTQPSAERVQKMAEELTYATPADIVVLGEDEVYSVVKVWDGKIRLNVPGRSGGIIERDISELAPSVFKVVKVNGDRVAYAIWAERYILINSALPIRTTSSPTP